MDHCGRCRPAQQVSFRGGIALSIAALEPDITDVSVPVYNLPDVRHINPAFWAALHGVLAEAELARTPKGRLGGI